MDVDDRAGLTEVKSTKRKLSDMSYDIGQVELVFKEEPLDVPVTLSAFNLWYDEYFPASAGGEIDFCLYRAIPSIVARIFSKFPYADDTTIKRYVDAVNLLLEQWEEKHIEMRAVIGTETTYGHGDNARRKITRILTAMLDFHYGSKEFNDPKWMDVHRSSVTPDGRRPTVTDECIYRHLTVLPRNRDSLLTSIFLTLSVHCPHIDNRSTYHAFISNSKDTISVLEYANESDGKNPYLICHSRIDDFDVTFQFVEESSPNLFNLNKIASHIAGRGVFCDVSIKFLCTVNGIAEFGRRFPSPVYHNEPYVWEGLPGSETLLPPTDPAPTNSDTETPK